MLNLKHYSRMAVMALLVVVVASCAKRDENLVTDYESKKASADKLITEVNEGLARMEAEHASMMRDLDSAGDASKDSARANAIRQDMTRHTDQSNKVKALVDSVKTYTTASTDNDEQLREANDRLGTHFDDLSNEWKTLQDQHAKLQQDIQDFAVGAAGDAVIDSARAAGGTQTSATSGSGTGTGSKSATSSRTSTGTKKRTSSGEVVNTPPNRTEGGDTRRTTPGQTNNQPGKEQVNTPPGNTQGGEGRRSGSAQPK
jgi:hypothetical protein